MGSAVKYGRLTYLLVYVAVGISREIEGGGEEGAEKTKTEPAMEEVVLHHQPQQQQPPQETKSALWRREEQLRRWAISETNSTASTTRNPAAVRVRFHDGCVFLAACSSGDRDEVSALLGRPPPADNDGGGRTPTDINTANVDGLTALHQVPIARVDRSLQSKPMSYWIGSLCCQCS